MNGPDLRTTARALAADAVCAEVVGAWQADGIDSVLLKGPTLADWLYPDAARGYGDVDLLVAPTKVMDAASVLARIGFEPVGHHVSVHAHPWLRGSDQAVVDLHIMLWGPHRGAERVWEELQFWLELRRVGATDVRILNGPARCLLVALHAAHHPEDRGKPREDLVRALSRAPFSLWSEAEHLGDLLWALRAMAEGLSLVPEGERTLARLPLAQAAAVAEREHAPLAIGFQRIAMAPDWRARLRVLVGAVVQPGDELGQQLGTVPKSKVEMLLAYARRGFWLLMQTPRTILALRRHAAARTTLATRQGKPA